MSQVISGDVNISDEMLERDEEFEVLKELQKNFTKKRESSSNAIELLELSPQNQISLSNQNNNNNNKNEGKSKGKGKSKGREKEEEIINQEMIEKIKMEENNENERSPYHQPLPPKVIHVEKLDIQQTGGHGSNSNLMSRSNSTTSSPNNSVNPYIPQLTFLQTGFYFIYIFENKKQKTKKKKDIIIIRELAQNHIQR